MIEGVVVDPERKEVRPVLLEPDDLDAIYQELDCSTITGVYPEGEDGLTVYVDDEGLFREELYFFVIEGFPQPLVGRGLILGADAEGASIDSPIDCDEVRERVDFGVPVKAGHVLLFVGDKNVREIQG